MTDAQARVLAALRRVCADGWPANVREVAEEAGLASAGNTFERLVQLEALGLVETNPRQPTRKGGWRPTPLGLQQPPAAVS